MRIKADAHMAKVMPIIEAIWAAGITGLKPIARELTRRGVPTFRGGRWDATRVRVLIGRAADPVVGVEKTELASGLAARRHSNRAPYLPCGRRHLGRRSANSRQRVVDRVHHCGDRAQGAGLADPFDAKRIVGAGAFVLDGRPR